jgi:hypothetical protein
LLDVIGEMRAIEVAADVRGSVAEPARVTVAMVRGRLLVRPTQGMPTVTGSVHTNLPAFEPIVARTTDGVEIGQRTRDLERDWPDGAEAIWRLGLATTPMDLSVYTHSVEAELELGGAAIRSLQVRGDAGAIVVGWSRPNRLDARSLDFATYVGPIALAHLGRARAAEVRVRNVVGPITIDLGPRLAVDVELRVETVAGPIEIVVPEGVSASAEVESGIGAVLAASWTRRGDEWRLGDPAGRPRATIVVRSGQGPVELATR